MELIIATLKDILPPPLRMFFTVILGKRVTEGTKLDLIIPFKGKILSGETVGFYAFPDDANGTVAVTQFQSMNARMAYPCFDEPRFQGCLSIVPEKILIYKSLFSLFLLSV